ncbi:MAG TPA: acetylxylan esterase [Verrucomicrobiota bacterium]|nr:acetylxylan esterase [Verrucomicrobiota bacterium]HNU52669.1 acetylxylan esterase [Verrucomicrobiota bacterium]
MTPATSAPPPQAAQFRAPAELTAHPIPPNPLVFENGQPVKSKSDWNRRRLEIKALFRHYMYGGTPAKPVRPRFAVDRTDADALGGKATLKQVTIALGDATAPRIHLMIVIPNRRSGTVPAFLGLNFCGNHTVLADPRVALPVSWMSGFCKGCTNNRATDAARGSEAEGWAIEQSIDRGYAVATFYNGDAEPDRPEAAEGIRAYYARRGDRADWGTIAAWGWSLSRALDYLVTDPAIDARRVAVVGHSRNGKAALVAAALDERFAMAIPLQAGCGGTAPNRSTVGESVKAINDRFPHWFNAVYKQFNLGPDRLPFDQHELIALCAPRPVLLPNAVEDTWANPEGQFAMARAASPVYRFLGVDGLAADRMPPLGQPVLSRLGYFIRPGKHSMTREDWRVFLDFADRHLR